MKRRDLALHGHRTDGWLRTRLTAAAGVRRLVVDCGRSSPAPAARPSSGGESPFEERATRIQLHVINLNWADARVYAHKSTQRIPLGSVPGKGERQFSLDWSFSLPLAIEFDLLAVGRCTTSQLSVDPGDIVELQIPVGNLNGPCG